ncbi:rna recognition motif-containing protein [Cystoisospora suis]|uniref:Rna recognition motif-containing protein n=1 Tax=Cystoisospora suis TaxID=483139 RepID=A0A2C6KTI3_9APIC|nr:rna recognition motif-containing protein [Cystoisospora suis]
MKSLYTSSPTGVQHEERRNLPFPGAKPSSGGNCFSSIPSQSLPSSISRQDYGHSEKTMMEDSVSRSQGDSYRMNSSITILPPPSLSSHTTGGERNERSSSLSSPPPPSSSPLSSSASRLETSPKEMSQIESLRGSGDARYHDRFDTSSFHSSSYDQPPSHLSYPPQGNERKGPSVYLPAQRTENMTPSTAGNQRCQESSYPPETPPSFQGRRGGDDVCGSHEQNRWSGEGESWSSYNSQSGEGSSSSCNLPKSSPSSYDSFTDRRYTPSYQQGVSAEPQAFDMNHSPSVSGTAYTSSSSFCSSSPLSNSYYSSSPPPLSRVMYSDRLSSPYQGDRKDMSSSSSSYLFSSHTSCKADLDSPPFSQGSSSFRPEDYHTAYEKRQGGSRIEGGGDQEAFYRQRELSNLNAYPYASTSETAYGYNDGGDQRERGGRIIREGDNHRERDEKTGSYVYLDQRGEGRARGEEGKEDLSQWREGGQWGWTTDGMTSRGDEREGYSYYYYSDARYMGERNENERGGAGRGDYDEMSSYMHSDGHRIDRDSSLNMSRNGDMSVFSVMVCNVPTNLTASDIAKCFSCVAPVVRSDPLLTSEGNHTGRVCVGYATREAAATAARRSLLISRRE